MVNSLVIFAVGQADTESVSAGFYRSPTTGKVRLHDSENDGDAVDLGQGRVAAALIERSQGEGADDVDESLRNKTRGEACGCVPTEPRFSGVCSKMTVRGVRSLERGLLGNYSAFCTQNRVCEFKECTHKLDSSLVDKPDGKPRGFCGCVPRKPEFAPACATLSDAGVKLLKDGLHGDYDEYCEQSGGCIFEQC
mmetsp:Transcript_72959/g.167421  ORF Transcript_72959/g.167421 Transcript_72959/m.167421 type:complete len:194 (-) Transcript_72959:166-747(-)